MSQAKPSSLSQGLTLQNPQNKVSETKQCFEKQILPEQFNQDQKKQEDNDYQCEFKLVVKEKFKQKLKNQSTNQLFTIVINEIIQQRIKRNFVADNDQLRPPSLDPNIKEQKVQEQSKKLPNGPSQLERLKAQDQQVKKKIKQLIRRRPQKKALTTYELDPNRDKGFILAKRMNEIKQQREKKYVQSKKQNQEMKKSLIQSQFATISCVEKYSNFLVQKTSNRRLRKQSQDLRLPMLNLSKSYRNQSENDQFDFLSHSRSKTQKEISEDGRSENLLTVRYDSVALSSRSSYNSKSKDKKRNLPRQIQILRKSQKITEKYQNKKMVHQILVEMISTSVKLVESKKQFFHNAPPKPVHQMIWKNKENNKKSNQPNVSKPQKFRINLYLKQSAKEKTTNKIETLNDFETKSDIENSSRVYKINQSFDICLSNRSEKTNNEIEENSSYVQQPQEQKVEDEQEKKSEDQIDSQEDGLLPEADKQQIKDESEEQESLELQT